MIFAQKSSVFRRQPAASGWVPYIASKTLGLGLLTLATFGVAARDLPALAQQPEETGPPQFTTIPIQNRMRETELDNGHVIYVPPVARFNIRDAGERPPGGNQGNRGQGKKGNGTPDFGEPGGVTALVDPEDCEFGSLDSSSNFNATCALDSYQGEPMLAADPGDPVLIGAQNDIYPGNCDSNAVPGTFGDCGLSASVSNDGANWQRFKFSRNWGGHDFLIGFDPSATVDSVGDIFVAYGVADSGVNAANGIVVVTSTDGGNTWTKTNPVVLDLKGRNFEDKYWITADTNPASQFTDRLYVAWDRNKGNNQILMVSYSSDQGQTWSEPVKINDGNSRFERVIYAFPAVAPNDTVYALWHDYARQQIFIDKSMDGGDNWGSDVVVANTNIGFAVEIGCNGGRDMTPAPQMAIAADSTIYVVFVSDSIPGAGRDLDVYITSSNDAGTSWSPPARVSQTSVGHQYNPAIAIDSSGVVNVSYLDRRDDDTTFDGDPVNCRTHTYLSRNATDSQVTDEDSNFNGNPNGPGDYSGIATLGTTAHPYFADHRDSNDDDDGVSGSIDGGFEIYSAAVASP